MSRPNLYNIGLVSHLLGIREDTLRKWESRYGFPSPVRSEKGRRSYSDSDLASLKKVQSLIVSGLPVKEAICTLKRNLPTSEAASQEAVKQSAFASKVIRLLKNNDLMACRREIHDLFLNYKVLDAIEDHIAPLMSEVGESWYHGRLCVFHEHAISSIVEESLAVASMSKRLQKDSLKVLLTTPPGERHAVGLNLVHVYLASVGAQCYAMGPELDFEEVVKAAEAFDIDVVAVSISQCVKPKIIKQYLHQLREMLSGDVKVWLGGRGLVNLHSIPERVECFLSIRELDRAYSSFGNLHGDPNRSEK